MGKVVASASMSLDGCIAKADNTIGHLFDWFDNGDVELRTINPDITLHHPDASFELETRGVGAAVARAQVIAGDRTVAATAGTIARQCLELGLLDEVAIDLVPVVLGGGRPFFGELSPGDVALGDPRTCIQSEGVMHLVYPVGRS